MKAADRYGYVKNRCADLSRATATLADIPEMTVQMSSYGEGNDRTAAIMLAADLENCIDQALMSHFVEGRAALLFKQKGTLGTLSNKIDLLYALGKFNEETWQNLEIIRIVRNVFAHCQRPVTFDTPEIAAYCEYLTISVFYNPEVKQFLDELVGTPRRILPAKQNYSLVCRQLASNFLHLRDKPDGTLP